MNKRWEIKIKEFTKKEGADLVGIAPVGRFKEAPKGFHPKDILADARSVIAIGKYFPLGILMGTSKSAMTKAAETVFIALDRCAYETSCFIENGGEQAVPVPADTPYLFWDDKKQQGKGDLSHKHSAVLAGLGTLGKNSLLLTPQYGNLVGLVSIVTTAPLKGDPLFNRELCIKQCRLCIDSCPAKAIREGGIVIQRKCRKYHTISTQRGFKLEACWECRKACPVRGRHNL
jgi:epoxyqueuosine reductase